MSASAGLLLHALRLWNGRAQFRRAVNFHMMSSYPICRSTFTSLVPAFLTANWSDACICHDVEELTDPVPMRVIDSTWTHFKPRHLFHLNTRSIRALADGADCQIALCGSAERILNMDYLHSPPAGGRHQDSAPTMFEIPDVSRQSAQYRPRLKNGELFAVLQKTDVAHAA